MVKYLSELKKTELEEQLIDLYHRFPVVKEYYDFVFNPKEDKLLQEAKIKISNEYFPLKRKRAKARRSVAQKYIKHFVKLGVDPHLTTDLMGNSFNELVQYVSLNALLSDFKDRIIACYIFAQDHHWPNREGFSKSLDIID